MQWQAADKESFALDDKVQRQDEQEVETRWEALTALLLHPPYEVDRLTFYGRMLILACCFIWGPYFILNGIDWQVIGSSFLHNINLPFHEFGHLLFMPFGEFWSILGGSLFQIILPLIILLAFLIRQQDNFSASVMLWWCGQNFIDVSPYIADAQLRNLPLILNKGDESHDRGNLLAMTGYLQHTQAIAYASFTIGAVIICISLIWGSYLLRAQKKVLK
ncbi:hypothetical protein [Psychromonas sp.]|uniref:hypothetical protein n=1 Tax=Psychromonas sp. TaxID=1884585 RepID=UPI0035682D28